MQVFKFNAGAHSVERAVADAIGQGIAQEIAQRREHDDNMPQRFAQLLERLDESERARSQSSRGATRLQSRKVAED